MRAQTLCHRGHKTPGAAPTTLFDIRDSVTFALLDYLMPSTVVTYPVELIRGVPAGGDRHGGVIPAMYGDSEYAAIILVKVRETTYLSASLLLLEHAGCSGATQDIEHSQRLSSCFPFGPSLLVTAQITLPVLIAWIIRKFFWSILLTSGLHIERERLHKNPETSAHKEVRTCVCGGRGSSLFPSAAKSLNSRD